MTVHRELAQLEPNGTCSICTHPFKDHQLIAENPDHIPISTRQTLLLASGGRIECPECDCHSTWSLGIPIKRIEFRPPARPSLPASVSAHACPQDPGTGDLDAAVKPHTDAAVEGGRESVGSIVGTLGSVTVKGRMGAGLWPDRGGPRVRLWFTEEQLPALRDALACRVQVSGLIRRDAAGRAVEVTVRRVERLPPRGAGKPLTGLVGLVPSLTGDLSTLAFLDEIRGAS